jgi:hypothetical protein
MYLAQAPSEALTVVPPAPIAPRQASPIWAILIGVALVLFAIYLLRQMERAS